MASKRVLLTDQNGNQVMPITDAKNVYVTKGRTVSDLIGTGSIGRIDVVELHDIDTQMSDTSENAAQNKVIKAYVDAETQARTAADNELDGKITTEAEARAAADSTLDEKITAETTAREEKDAELKATIYNDRKARMAADDKLQMAVDDETMARKQADELIKGNIRAETTDRTIADDKLQAAIDAEAQARAVADDELDGKIAAEARARAAADSTLEMTLNDKADEVYIYNISTGSSEFDCNLVQFINADVRLADVITKLNFTFWGPDDPEPYDPADIPPELKFTTSLSFSTGDTAPEVSYSTKIIINWIGTDCTMQEGSSVFMPGPNMRYDIIIYFNGAHFVGLVNGFTPATVSNSGQTEATA